MILVNGKKAKPLYLNKIISGNKVHILNHPFFMPLVGRKL
jgi:hypothetical protein